MPLETTKRRAKTDPIPHELPACGDRVNTAQEFADFMSSLMTAVVAGRVTPSVANAAANLGGKLLKAVEMQLKYSDRDGAKAVGFLGTPAPRKVA